LPGEITVVKAHGIKVAFVAFAPYRYDASLLDLPAARVLITIELRTGPVRASGKATAALNSQLAGPGLGLAPYRAAVDVRRAGGHLVWRNNRNLDMDARPSPALGSCPDATEKRP
jgi:hypothetical protein